MLCADGAAAAIVGLLVLALHDWLAQLFRFPQALVLTMGIVNLAYASYSGTLAVRALGGRPPGRAAINLLIGGNLAWTVVCMITAILTWRTASVFGHAQLVLEGIFVAALAALEHRLVRPQTA